MTVKVALWSETNLIDFGVTCTLFTDYQQNTELDFTTGQMRMGHMHVQKRARVLDAGGSQKVPVASHQGQVVHPPGVCTCGCAKGERRRS